LISKLFSLTLFVFVSIFIVGLSKTTLSLKKHNF